MTVGSLFAGIGGFDLGFERAGIKTIWQVEANEYCRQILEEHFPSARRIKDVRDVYRFAHEYEPCGCCGDEPWCERHGMHFGECECIGCSQWDDEWETPDIICGGFPCQDISHANPGGDALDGERSGLWWEQLRIISHLRPRFVVVENVSALLDRGIGDVLGSLAGIGYDAEWKSIRASHFGAPHARNRIFIVAYPNTSGTCVFGNEDGIREIKKPQLWKSFGTTDLRTWLASECGLSGDVNGLSGYVDQAEALGNAVVPQIAEWIAQRIKEVHKD